MLPSSSASFILRPSSSTTCNMFPGSFSWVQPNTQIVRNRRQVYIRVVGQSSFVQINSISCFQRCGPESSLLDSKLFLNKPTLINIYLWWVEISTEHYRNKADRCKGHKRNNEESWGLKRRERSHLCTNKQMLDILLLTVKKFIQDI